MASGGGGHVAREPLSCDEDTAVERIAGGEGAGLREDVARRRRGRLDVEQRSVAPQHRQRSEKERGVRPFRHRGEVAHHEGRRIVSVAAGAVRLLRSREIEPGRGEEVTLQVEAGLRVVLAQQSAEELGRQAGVEVLAHLERDLHLLAEGR